MQIVKTKVSQYPSDSNSSEKFRIFVNNNPPQKGSHSGSGRLWSKMKKFFYFVFLLMILALSVFHTRESFQHVTHYYQENYSPTHHQKKEDIMEKITLSDNQAKQDPIQISTQDGYHF